MADSRRRLDWGAGVSDVAMRSAPYKRQFTREYGRIFGSAPTKDINRLRKQGKGGSDA